MKQLDVIDFMKKLTWIDRRPLWDILANEPYRIRLFEQAASHDDGFDSAAPGANSRVNYNLILSGRAKKNWKSADLVLYSMFKLLFWRSWGGNGCYLVANDLDQSDDDLELARLIIKANPKLTTALKIKQNVIERKDGKGFLEILPAGDVKGAHGKTFLLAGFDEIHGYKDWGILEAMQLDPSRPDAQLWLTSYASIFHRPNVPLFDLFQTGKKGGDPRMLFSWYASDYCTDADFSDKSPEERANPSMGSWGDPNYLAQQKARLPSHRYRRLHLNLPGSPEGSAFSAEKIMDAIERGVTIRKFNPTLSYVAFCDMSGGSSDSATLSIAHRTLDGKLILDLAIDQGQPPPFDPRKAVERFAKVLKEYSIFTVFGDRYAGQTFVCDFERAGINYVISDLSASELYESIEPMLNAGEIVLLDIPMLESQFLGLVWKGNSITHPSAEHDDLANAASGAIHIAAHGYGDQEIASAGSRVVSHESWAAEFRDYHSRKSFWDEF